MNNNNTAGEVTIEEGWYIHIKSEAYYYVTGLIKVRDPEGNWKEMVEYQNKSSEKTFARFPENFKDSFVKASAPAISAASAEPINKCKCGPYCEDIGGGRCRYDSPESTVDSKQPTPSPEPARLTAEADAKPKDLSDFMSGKEMSDLILSQNNEIRDYSKEAVAVRGYLLDKYGPFGREAKIVSGEEETIDMVKAVLELKEQEKGEKDKEIIRLSNLLKQVFDLQYDNMSWFEFEKQVLNPPTGKEQP